MIHSSPDGDMIMVVWGSWHDDPQADVFRFGRSVAGLLDTCYRHPDS